MDTVERVNELAAERGLSLYQLARTSGVPYSTLRNTAKRNGQLTVDTIERICVGLEIPMCAFFADGACRHAGARRERRPGPGASDRG